MLGRTRPASRLLLWPRSTTPVRFTTTAATNPRPKANNDDATGVRDGKTIQDRDGGGPSSRGFSGVKPVLSNTEPLPLHPWAKLDQAVETARPINYAATKAWAQDIKSSGTAKRTSQIGRGDDGSRGTNSFRTIPQASNSQVNGWRPFAPNPEHVLGHRKPSTAGRIAPFAFNPALAAKGLRFGLPELPLPTSLSQKENIVEQVRTDDGVRGLNRGWAIPPRRDETSKSGSYESEVMPEDGAPPRSEIIRMMKTWNYEPPPATEAEPSAQEEIEANKATAPRGKKAEQLPPLDREFRDWLISATEEAIHEAENGGPTNSVSVYNGPTVLILNGASRSLLASDFYRIARQGKHLGDWAVGIARIVQARHPATYEPLGKYYIFFHTRAAALAYKEEVWRLHLLSRGAAHLDNSTSSTSSSSSLPSLSDSTPGPLPLAVDHSPTKNDTDPALRGYTLLPNSAMLDLKLHLCKDLPLPSEDTLSTLSEDLQLSSSPSSSKRNFHPSTDHHFVLVSLEGARTTVAALHAAIDRDGREERRVPWALAVREDGRPSIAAVVPGSDTQKDEFLMDDRAADDPSARTARFIVPFTDATEARRFVRNWHRREMKDLEGRDMVIMFNITALW